MTSSRRRGPLAICGRAGLERLWNTLDPPLKPTLLRRRKKNLRALQLPLGHTKIESTIGHLEIEVNDALQLAEETDA